MSRMDVHLSAEPDKQQQTQTRKRQALAEEQRPTPARYRGHAAHAGVPGYVGASSAAPGDGKNTGRTGVYFFADDRTK